MEILNSSGIHVHMLPVWRDIDRPEDIIALINESKQTGFTESKTITFLHDHGLTEYC